MPIKDVSKDFEALTMTVSSEFSASTEAVWELWADPRKLERWWGPPSHPATFVAHELEPGRETSYYMTGPDGSRYHGYWRVEEVEAPGRLRFVDGFADDEGKPNETMPATPTTVTIAAAGEGTAMTIVSTYASREAMEQVLEMGMEQGLREALGQIDALLAAEA